MSLDGLRAWIAEVERKLGKRTRVFLALAVIAIGIGGAAVYLAIDARESSVSESDLQALQDELAAQGGVGSTAAGAGVAQLEAELAELRTQVEGLESGSGKNQGGSSSGGDGGAGNSSGGAKNGGAAVVPGGGVPGGAEADPARIQELLEETEKRNEEAEREQAGE